MYGLKTLNEWIKNKMYGLKITCMGLKFQMYGLKVLTHREPECTVGAGRGSLPMRRMLESYAIAPQVKGSCALASFVKWAEQNHELRVALGACIP